MTQIAFLAESSSAAPSAIVICAGTGLVISYDVIADQRHRASWNNLAFSVPWPSLGIVQ
jgi:hypothetical protein